MICYCGEKDIQRGNNDRCEFRDSAQRSNRLKRAKIQVVGGGLRRSCPLDAESENEREVTITASGSVITVSLACAVAVLLHTVRHFGLN